MIYLIALIPATMLTIAGYFVLYLAHRSEGAFRAFGKYLGFWAITLAGLVILGALFAAANHGGGGITGMHRQHMRLHGPYFFSPFPGDSRDPGNEPPPPGPDGAPNSQPPPEPASPPQR